MLSKYKGLAQITLTLALAITPIRSGFNVSDIYQNQRTQAVRSEREAPFFLAEIDGSRDVFTVDQKGQTINLSDFVQAEVMSYDVNEAGEVLILDRSGYLFIRGNSNGQDEQETYSFNANDAFWYDNDKMILKICELPDLDINAAYILRDPKDTTSQHSAYTVIPFLEGSIGHLECAVSSDGTIAVLNCMDVNDQHTAGKNTAVQQYRLNENGRFEEVGEMFSSQNIRFLKPTIDGFIAHNDYSGFTNNTDFVRFYSDGSKPTFFRFPELDGSGHLISDYSVSPDGESFALISGDKLMVATSDGKGGFKDPKMIYQPTNRIDDLAFSNDSQYITFIEADRLVDGRSALECRGGNIVTIKTDADSICIDYQLPKDTYVGDIQY